MTDTSKPSSNDPKEVITDNHQEIAQFAIDLHIARRNFLIYPSTHEQTRRSLTRAYDRIRQLLSQQTDVSLVVLKSGLAVGKKALSTDSLVFKDLAAVLKQYQVATLVFLSGLEKSELLRFLQLIVTDRDKILNIGGMETAIEKARLSHIKVQTVDYSQLQVTAESEIDRSFTAEEGDESIWQQFVNRFALTDRQANNSSESSGQTTFNPEKLAQMLNSQAVDATSAIAQYESVFSEASTANQQPDLVHEGLPQFQRMIKALNPDLQDQFLSATFGQCGQMATMADTAHLVDGLGGDLIVRMLAQASEQGKKISPSLLAFVKKMARIKTPASGSVSPHGPVPEQETFGAKEVGTLLDHEQYDQYVDEGYSQLLQNIISKSQQQASVETMEYFKDELKTDLDTMHIHSHMGRAMTVLMDGSQDIESYRQWARQLAYMLDELLESHAFIFLMDTLHRFIDEIKSRNPDKAKIAGLVLDRFSDPKFVARAVEIVQDMDGQEDQDAMDFLSALGEPVVVEIFEGLDPNETFYANECLESKVLDNLANFASCEALERLDDPRPEYVRRMIRIVRRMGDKQSAERVRPMLNNENMEIRLEALATLIKFRNKWGLVRLRDILEDPATPELKEAIELAARYKVLEVLPQLIVYAERSGGDRKRQEVALRALGTIGDVRAIPTLAKLANQRWSISKKNSEHIKRVVFESLADYPIKEVKDLLHCGLKQKDTAIQACCEKVLRKHLTQ